MEPDPGVVDNQSRESHGMRLPLVFISYSRDDREFATLLRKRLSKIPFQPWQDVQDIIPGGRWDEDIDRALRACDVLLVVMSRSAQASLYVNYEWAFALGAGAKVI